MAERRAADRLRRYLAGRRGTQVVLAATAETLIALALIFGFARKLTYIAAIVFSVLIWSTAEGFGGPYTSGASDIGTAIVYAVVFAGLLALSYYAAPDRYSADHYLDKKISWWWRVAEMRRPVPAQAAVTPASEAAVPVPQGAVPPPTAPADTPRSRAAAHRITSSRP